MNGKREQLRQMDSSGRTKQAFLRQGKINVWGGNSFLLCCIREEFRKKRRISAPFWWQIKYSQIQTYSDLSTCRSTFILMIVTVISLKESVRVKFIEKI